jgi:hypothetical protein
VASPEDSADNRADLPDLPPTGSVTDRPEALRLPAAAAQFKGDRENAGGLKDSPDNEEYQGQVLDGVEMLTRFMSAPSAAG